MSSVITLLFAPSFLLLIHYFEFRFVVLLFIVLSVLLLIYSFIQKKKPEDFIVLSIYFLLLNVAYFFTSLDIIKFIPVFISMIFFSLFAEAALYKKALIYKLTKKFYKKKLSEQEIEYLKRGDSYWAISILIYMIIQGMFVLYANDTLWALYSSIGWYIYFVIVLALQIIYGKVYVLKVSS